MTVCLFLVWSFIFVSTLEDACACTRAPLCLGASTTQWWIRCLIFFRLLDDTWCGDFLEHQFVDCDMMDSVCGALCLGDASTVEFLWLLWSFCWRPREHVPEHEHVDRDVVVGALLLSRLPWNKICTLRCFCQHLCWIQSQLPSSRG